MVDEMGVVVCFQCKKYGVSLDSIFHIILSTQQTRTYTHTRNVM